MNTLYNFPNIPEIADKWIEPLAKPPTENNGIIIGLSTVQRGDFIAEGLKEWKGRYREGEGFNKWEPVESEEE